MRYWKQSIFPSAKMSINKYSIVLGNSIDCILVHKVFHRHKGKYPFDVKYWGRSCYHDIYTAIFHLTYQSQMRLSIPVKFTLDISGGSIENQ